MSLHPVPFKYPEYHRGYTGIQPALVRYGCLLYLVEGSDAVSEAHQDLLRDIRPVDLDRFTVVYHFPFLHIYLYQILRFAQNDIQ